MKISAAIAIALCAVIGLVAAEGFVGYPGGYYPSTGQASSGFGGIGMLLGLFVLLLLLPSLFNSSSTSSDQVILLNSTLIG